MKALRLDLEARDEVREAADWYRDRGLARGFVAELRRAFGAIRDRPQTWPRVPAVPAELGVRRFLLSPFPYSVVYLELESEIRIMALAHFRREPGFWRHRL